MSRFTPPSEEELAEATEGEVTDDSLPPDEDLEKIKITLNWLIKNRNKVRSFYLNNYSSKDELYSNISSIFSWIDISAPLNTLFLMVGESAPLKGSRGALE